MKKLFLLASLFLIISCQRTEPVIPSETISQDGLTITSPMQEDYAASSDRFSFLYKVPKEDRYFKMESQQDNNQIRSVLSYKAENQNWQTISTIKVNLSNESYRETMNQQIIETAEQVKASLDYAFLSNIESVIEQLPILIFDKIGLEQYSKDQPLTIFYHMGVLKTAKRALETSQACTCTSFANYTNAESPFFCTEDKLISRTNLISTIENKIANNQFADKSFSAQKTLDYLNNSTEEMIAVSKVDPMLKAEFNDFWSKELTQRERDDILEGINISTEGRLPYDPSCLLYGVDQGSDCGCCGNYSGGCWYCALACYVHDNTCEDCSPSWYCLSGCIPGPC